MSTRLGAGSGFAGDRIDPAVALVRDADLDYLVFECLGERTIAQANARRLSGAGPAYDPLLRRRFEAVLPTARRRGTRVITNGGGADPVAAARMALEVAPGLRAAAVVGDDVLTAVRDLDPLVWEDGTPLSAVRGELVSANAYVGAEPIAQALETGADVVIGGRLADPSLYLGPLLHEHGWDPLGDPALLGRGTVVGHLLECAGQITGGYLADPGSDPVPGLDDLGFPFADVAADGTAVLGKLADAGGILTPLTATAQLLYEVGDPTTYLTPDVVADFSGVAFEAVGPDRVSVSGATGRARTDTLKVTLGFRGGWLGEGQISYAGPRALARAELAAETVRARLARVHGLDPDTITTELIGAGAAFRGLGPATDPLEVRVRVSAVTPTSEQADAVGWEVEALYTNGPAAGGGARRSTSEVLAVKSCLIPRDRVRTEVVSIR